jgi:hypothetical protein
LEDAIDNAFDRAIIISADSDHVPAIRRARVRAPRAQLFVAAPPKRRSRARDLMNVCNSGMEITQGRLARCLFPQVITDGNGNRLAMRPISYDPPAGWVPPP